MKQWRLREAGLPREAVGLGFQYSVVLLLKISWNHPESIFSTEDVQPLPADWIHPSDGLDRQWAQHGEGKKRSGLAWAMDSQHDHL